MTKHPFLQVRVESGKSNISKILDLLLQGPTKSIQLPSLLYLKYTTKIYLIYSLYCIDDD